MDIGSILLLFALLLLVGLFIARPILEHKGTVVSQEEHEYSSLLAERDRALTALQELDFDYTLGKIPEEDYPAQRLLILQYGADVLRKLDAFQATPTALSAEDRLEQAIAARRIEKAIPSEAGEGALTASGSGGNGANPALKVAADDHLEVMIAERRRKRQGKTAGFCHQCGSPLQQSDRFCPRCGIKIS